MVSHLTLSSPPTVPPEISAPNIPVSVSPLLPHSLFPHSHEAARSYMGRPQLAWPVHSFLLSPRPLHFCSGFTQTGSQRLAVKLLTYQHVQFLDFFIMPFLHGFGFDSPEVACEELSASSLLRRWFWEAWRHGEVRQRREGSHCRACYCCRQLGLHSPGELWAAVRNSSQSYPPTRDKAHRHLSTNIHRP